MEMNDNRDDFPLDVSPITAIIGSSTYLLTLVEDVSLSMNSRIAALPGRSMVATREVLLLAALSLWTSFAASPEISKFSPVGFELPKNPFNRDIVNVDTCKRHSSDCVCVAKKASPDRERMQRWTVVLYRYYSNAPHNCAECSH